jgi:recombination protein RecR
LKFTSSKLENAVIQLAKLPGVGKKTALRLALFLAEKDESFVQDFTKGITTLSQELFNCKECHSYSDEELCEICQDQNRDKSTICVVESVKDVMAIEDTNQFRGLYHVLGGVISPIEGIGPSDLNIEKLVERTSSGLISELIMAINPTIEGDTTIYYITKRLKGQPVKISTIARGVSFGAELEYADEFTLGRSIISRMPYQLED